MTEHIKLAQFPVLKGPLSYDSLRATVRAYVNGRDEEEEVFVKEERNGA